jgi:hypothetical protein
MPNYWLMKSEPSEASVDDALAACNSTVPWTGVRSVPFCSGWASQCLSSLNTETD